MTRYRYGNKRRNSRKKMGRRSEGETIHQQAAVLRRNLRRRLKWLELSARQVSLRVGASKDLVANILSKRSLNPQLATIKKLATELLVPVEWLLGSAPYYHLPLNARPACLDDAEQLLKAEQLRNKANDCDDPSEKLRLRKFANKMDHLDDPFPIGLDDLRNVPEENIVDETMMVIAECSTHLLTRLTTVGLANLNAEEIALLSIAMSRAAVLSERDGDRIDSTIAEVIDLAKKRSNRNK